MPDRDKGRADGSGTEEGRSGVRIRRRVLSSQNGLPGGLLATDVGAVEKPLDSSDEYELPNELMYGDVGEARDTQDIEAFPPLRRLCERVLPMLAKLGELPMRCKPLSSRCLPLSFGFSIMIASVGVCGGEDNISLSCSTMTDSIETGSMVDVMMEWCGALRGMRPRDVACTEWMRVCLRSSDKSHAWGTRLRRELDY